MIQVCNWNKAFLATLLVLIGVAWLRSFDCDQNLQQGSSFITSSKKDFSSIYFCTDSDQGEANHLYSYHAHHPFSAPFQAESYEFDVNEKYSSQESFAVEFTTTNSNFSAIIFLYQIRLDVLLDAVNAFFHQKNTVFLVLLYHTWKIFPFLIALNI